MDPARDDVWAENVRYSPEGSSFDLCTREKRIPCRTDLLGELNVRNIVLCAAAAFSLGLDEETTDILGVDVPLVTIPVSGGRNLAAIIETAAINNRMKEEGVRSAQIFVDNIAKHNEAVARKRKQHK